MKIPFISNWLKKRSIENPSIPISSKNILDMFGITPAKSGVNVTEQTAIRMTAVFSCIRILAETPASLPFIVYRRLGGRGKERATDHPTYTVLHDQANPEMTAMSLRETIQGHAAGWGNGYAYIVRRDGWTSELWPLLPDRTRPIRRDGRLYYLTHLATGEPRLLRNDQVLHIPGFGFDGMQGYNPIRLAREAIGLGMAAEEFGSNFFGQGTNIGGFVETPGVLSNEAFNRLKNQLNEKYQGLGKSHLLMILEEGMKFQKAVIPPNEAQFIELRKFQVTEIARLFRIPPHMIADLERSTFSNIEMQSLEFVVHTLRPWLVRWEQAVNTKLFTPSERKEFFAEHIVEGLLRGDSKSRAEFYGKMFSIGVYSQNDIREKENENPVDGGDKHYVPLNMVPVEMLEEILLKSKTGVNNAREVFFMDAATRIVAREVKDIRRALKKPDFADWLEQFYRDAPAWIEKTMRPVFFAYGGDVGAFAARYARMSLDELRGLEPEEIGQRLSEWEEKRPSEVVTEILGGAI